MLRNRMIPWLAAILIFLPTFALAQGEHQYVGVKKCKMCHKTQYKAWLQMKHSHAMEALKSDQALKFAKERGLDKPPSEAPECLKCHMTGYGEDPSHFASSFNPEDGVQCEACHGPGSDYRKKSIMKDWDKAVAKGLNPIRADDGTAEKWCVRCHNEESPSYKPFNFKEFWEKIKHPTPPKN